MIFGPRVWLTTVAPSGTLDTRGADCDLVAVAEHDNVVKDDLGAFVSGDPLDQNSVVLGHAVLLAACSYQRIHGFHPYSFRPAVRPAAGTRPVPDLPRNPTLVHAIRHGGLGRAALLGGKQNIPLWNPKADCGGIYALDTPLSRPQSPYRACISDGYAAVLNHCHPPPNRPWRFGSCRASPISRCSRSPCHGCAATTSSSSSTPRPGAEGGMI